MGSFLIGIMVTSVTFYIALIYGSVSIGLIGFAELVLMLLAFFYLLIYRRHLSADIRIPLAVAEKGKKVAVQITVDHTMMIPAAKVRYRVRCGNTFAGYAENFWWNGAGLRHGKQTIEKRMAFSHVGNYQLKLIKIRIYDLTGLFYVHKRIQKCADVQILPELDSVAVQISNPVRNYFGESESYDEFRPGADASQIFDVREYRPGDRLQRVHWKLSAKSDSLFIREDSQPLACAVVFLLNMQFLGRKRGHHAQRRRESYAEIFLTVAADLVYSMMDAGCPHYVVWQEDGEIRRLRVDDEESMYLFLVQFMRGCHTGTMEDLRQIYGERFRGEYPVHELELTPELALEMDGQKLMEFGRRDWKQKLTEMELIL